MNIKNKKYYSAPIVNSIRLDRDISLIMTTDPPPDPPGSNHLVEPPSSYSTPFGGNSPDYGDM